MKMPEKKIQEVACRFDIAPLASIFEREHPAWYARRIEWMMDELNLYKLKDPDRCGEDEKGVDEMYCAMELRDALRKMFQSEDEE